MQNTVTRSLLCGFLAVQLFFTFCYPILSNAQQSQDTQRIRELAGAWWEWALSLPAEMHPLSFDKSEISSHYCGIGQHGDVWFLGGAFTGESARRNCSVPAGKAIFFPVVNAQCSVIQGDGSTEEELRSCAKVLIDPVVLAEAAIDGEKLQPVRISSGLFSFTSPPGDINDVFGTAPNPSPAVADGYWVLLDPLGAGNHRIDIRGIIDLPGAYDFEVDVIYDISVVEPALD